MPQTSLRIICGCEESQIVTTCFRDLGFYNTFSCDLTETSGSHPEWHLKMDLFEAIELIKPKMLIAFPPCTHLAVSGARYFKEKIADGRQQQAIDFFMRIVNADIQMIAIENPIGIMSTKYRKPDQIIHPWMFGHGETKATCLWLKNLPKLIPTNIVEGREQKTWRMPPSKDRAMLRSKTYHGIAAAIANQYSKYL